MNEKSLEDLQKKAHRAYFGSIFFSAAVFLIIVSVLFFLLLSSETGTAYLRESPAEMITGLAVLPALLAIGIYLLLYHLLVRKTYGAFDQAFKQTYVVQMVQGMDGFEKLTYFPVGGFSYNEIRDSLAVNSGEAKYFKSEDLLAGTYRTIPFSYGDVVTRYMRRNGKRSEIRIIFQGQIMRFSLPEDFKWSFGHLQIFEKEFLSDFKGRRAPHQIRTENEDFNRRFEIFAADEHNAFYLLTPQMMEQIVRFADLAGSQVALTFVGAVLYVAVDRAHSMFDASIRLPLEKQRQLILDDVNLLKQAGELLIFGADALARREEDGPG